jgi:hypothetical protein
MSSRIFAAAPASFERTTAAREKLMNAISKRSTVVCVVLLLVACAAPNRVSETPLQLQSLEAREFETSKTFAFSSVLTVFQDLGYIVSSADRETGFITAASPAATRTKFWEAIGGIQTSGQTKATAFVEDIRPGFVSIRLNFVNARRRSTFYGQTNDVDEPVLDPKAYAAAFERIGNGIFVRTGSANRP